MNCIDISINNILNYFFASFLARIVLVQDIVNGNVYTIHRKGAVISWDEYIVVVFKYLCHFNCSACHGTPF
jgi:hypothetical protein